MKTNRWTMMAVLAGVLLAGSVRAGNLTPPGAPGPTMNTLAELYQKLTNSLAEVQATKAEVVSMKAEVLATKAEVLADQQNLADMQAWMVAAGMQQTSGDMVLIPAGSFVMGACTNVGQETISDAGPQHTVTVSAFYIDKYEVTSNLWRDVYTWATNKGYSFGTGWGGKATNHPVHSVDWYDAIAWCNARSQRDGFTPSYTNANGTVYTKAADNSFAGGCNWAAGGYRLPTEAEWEKAARGGVADSRFPWDDVNTIQHARANYQAHATSDSYDTSPTTGYHPGAGGTDPRTMAVGSFEPNGYGLYDMAGNVMEWCWDWYEDYYYAYSPGIDPEGPSGPILGIGPVTRVQRGGAWCDGVKSARGAHRGSGNPNGTLVYVGFRCARGL